MNRLFREPPTGGGANGDEVTVIGLIAEEAAEGARKAENSAPRGQLHVLYAVTVF